MIFQNEQELLKHFDSYIQKLEDEFNSQKTDADIEEEKNHDIESLLDQTLENPSEIWNDEKTFKEFPVFNFLRLLEDERTFHIILTYVSTDDEPTFIFLHFVTKNIEIVNFYRRGELVYDQAFEGVGFGAIEGDSISEGDPMAMGLFLSMLKVRQEKDVPNEEFRILGETLREETIEQADEIWRNVDLNGNQLVTFIREFPDHEIKDLYYIVLTMEEPNSHVHTLLFSFPTTDENLLDRYRRGENLQAEEVIKESSH